MLLLLLLLIFYFDLLCCLLLRRTQLHLTRLVSVSVQLTIVECEVVQSPLLGLKGLF